MRTLLITLVLCACGDESVPGGDEEPVVMTDGGVATRREMEDEVISQCIEDRLAAGQAGGGCSTCMLHEQRGCEEGDVEWCTACAPQWLPGYPANPDCNNGTYDRPCTR